MTRHKGSRAARLGAAAFSALMTGSGIGALAQPAPAAQTPIPIGTDDLKRMRELLEAQSRRLDEQERRLEDEKKTIESLRAELDAIRAGSDVAAARAERTAPATPSPVLSAPEPQGAGDATLDSVRAAGLPKDEPLAAPRPAAAPPPAALETPAAPVAASRTEPEPPLFVAQGAMPQTPAPSATMLPNRPVGEAPQTMENPAADVTALPEGARVLTPAGRFVAEASVEYDRTSSNRLVFRGVEIVPGIQLGLIDANEVARDTVVGTADFRYGILDRLEVEARIPFLYRHDRLTVLSQQISPSVPASTQTTNLEGKHLGDIELGLRYQLNRGTQGGPIYVGGLRVKTTTGVGPYDVNFDSNGIATELGTGSGFWAVEPSVTMLFPSDPVVIFINVGYLHNFKQNVDKNIGNTHVGEVSPGDAIDTSLGFGFALNPQFSFSLGFSNTYILPTRTELGTTVQNSNSLEAGSLTVGLSYIFSPTLTLSSNFDFGMTADAPDMRVVFRLPYRF